jgi:hypothetical protein
MLVMCLADRQGWQFEWTYSIVKDIWYSDRLVCCEMCNECDFQCINKFGV